MAMAAPRAATLRALNSSLGFNTSRCRQCSSMIIALRAQLLETPAPILFAKGQRRNKSSSSATSDQKRPTPPPRPSVGRILFAAFRGSFRSLGTAFRSRSLRAAFRQSPEEFVFAVMLLACSAAGVVYIYKLYYSYFYHEQFTRYPAPVAKSLRRALYYSNYSPDPKLALKYYKLALEQCGEFGLDPFSDDVLGIKIQLAAWLEKVGNFDNATKVLEALLADCKRWVETMEKSVKDGTAPKTLKAVIEPQGKEGENSSVAGLPDAPVETLWGKRTRVLGKAVGISVKLGELYANEHVMKDGQAHEHLTWAAETALRELRRRTVEGVKDGEGPWMSSEAIGGTLESLGHSYESKSQFHLALPLFFQALRLSQEPCHSAVIMNNIAACFAQHPILPPSETLMNTLLDKSSSTELAAPAETRASYLASAQRWALNANQHASEPQGDRRTLECDEACAVSLCNLGDIARLAGDLAEARRRFEQALAMSKKVEYAPGVAQAKTGLRELASS